MKKTAIQRKDVGDVPGIAVRMGIMERKMDLLLEKMGISNPGIDKALSPVENVDGERKENVETRGKNEGEPVEK